MNSRERFLAVLKGEIPDRTPLAHVSALTTIELQEITGCFMPEVHTNAEKLARLCFANHEVLGFDAVTFIINYFNEPAALGCQMKWGSKRELPIYTSHPWVKEEDANIPPDLLDREPVSTYLESIKIAKRDYGEKITILGKIMGPFSMVQVMHGVEKTMIDMLENPDKIRYFLQAGCSKVNWRWGRSIIILSEG